MYEYIHIHIHIYDRVALLSSAKYGPRPRNKPRVFHLHVLKDFAMTCDFELVSRANYLGHTERTERTLRRPTILHVDRMQDVQL